MLCPFWLILRPTDVQTIWLDHKLPKWQLVVKNSPAKARDSGDAGSIPGLERFPGGGYVNRLQYLAWEIPWTEESGGLQSTGSQRVGHDWSDWAHRETDSHTHTQDINHPLSSFSGKSVSSLTFRYLLGSFPGGRELWSHSLIPLLHTVDGGGLPETRIPNHSSVLSSSLY